MAERKTSRSVDRAAADWVARPDRAPLSDKDVEQLEQWWPAIRVGTAPCCARERCGLQRYGQRAGPAVRPGCIRAPRTSHEAFGAAGAAIVAHGSERNEVDARVADWSARGWRVAGCVADLAAPSGVHELQHCVASTLGAADILVLNASLEIIQSWAELTEETMQRQARVNLHTTVELIQAFLPAMSSRGWGRILAIGSVQEERPNAGHLFYSATKAAQTSMILNLARNEHAPGVTFNVLRPGAILTGRNRARLADPTFEARVVERISFRTHRRPCRLCRCRAAAVLGSRQLYQRCRPGGGRRNAPLKMP